MWKVKICASCLFLACSSASNPPKIAPLHVEPVVELVGNECPSRLGQLCMTQETARELIQTAVDREADADKSVEIEREKTAQEIAAHKETKKQLESATWWSQNGWSVAASVGAVTAVLGFIAGFAGSRAVR